MATPDTDIAPPELRLDQVVAHWAIRRPGRAALRWNDADGMRELSWRGFEDAIAHSAARLAQSIGAGERVAVVCANGAPFHVLVNALWRLGAGVVLIDRNWGPALVDDLLTLLNCRALFADPAQAPSPLPPGVARHAIPAPDVAPPRAVRAEVERGGAADADSVALYATTSGTTDNPKCVAITHRQIRTAYRGCLNQHDFSGFRFSACLFDVNSLGVLGVCFLMPRETGCGTRLFASFSLANVRATWSSLLAEPIDFVYLVPPLVRLLNTLAAQPLARVQRMLAFCSAAPVSITELNALESRFPLTVFNCYGLTELTFAVFFGCRGDDGSPSDSIGHARCIHARLVDDTGRGVDGAGQGEMYITGPMQTSAYVANERATRAGWQDGWLKTGDIAERDAQGRFYIRGRKKDVVLRGGYTYYLHELEHYLRRVPEIVDACAFKGRDLPSGDELCVVVQVAGKIDPDSLLQWIRSSMGSNKAPNTLYCAQRSLPRNSNGKILRQVLSGMHLDGSMAEWAAA